MINSLNSPPKVYFPPGDSTDRDFIWAFSPKAYGNMSFYYGNTQGAALNNRKEFLKTLGIDYRRLVCAKQVHGDCARYVTEQHSGKGALDYDGSFADTDSFITDKKNIPLAIFTADCLPIFLYDPQRPAVGLIHAGWRSTKENLAAKTILLMQGHFNTQPSCLRIAFGPAIRSCCYEVKEGFLDTFGSAVTKRGKGYYMGLAEANRKQLLAIGVKRENILDYKICTSCSNADYFSFRKEGGSCGRMMAVAMLK